MMPRTARQTTGSSIIILTSHCSSESPVCSHGAALGLLVMISTRSRNSDFWKNTLMDQVRPLLAEQVRFTKASLQVRQVYRQLAMKRLGNEWARISRVEGSSRSKTQSLSHGVASESSPRRKPWGGGAMVTEPRQGRQKQASNSFAAPRLLPCSADPPRLAPWATFWRCSAANALDSAPLKKRDAPRSFG